MTNQIHPTALIGDCVVIGNGNVIGPYSIVIGDVSLGDDNWIGPHVVIGTPGEMRGSSHSAEWATTEGLASVRIGSRNVIREFTTVQSGSIHGTVISDECYIMTKAHVPHDGFLGNGVTVSCSVMIGGHSVVMDGANLGLGSVVHQRTVIGTRAMVGMGSVVTRDVLPFSTVYGNPARLRTANSVGMSRAGLEESLISEISAALLEGNGEVLLRLAPKEFSAFEKFRAERGNH